jgi:hypothetical protein
MEGAQLRPTAVDADSHKRMVEIPDDIFGSPTAVELPPIKVPLQSADRQANEPCVSKPVMVSQRKTLGIVRLLTGITLAFGLGAFFRFPATALFLLPFIGVALAVAWGWTIARTVSLVIFASGFMSQATSIFVIPFTWPLRFVFFLALVGAFVMMIGWQTKEL